MSLLIQGKNFFHFDSLSSTNTHLMELLSKFKPFDECTVILADEQTAGRGQQAAHWESNKAENLTFSLNLYPSFLEVEKQFDISKVISLAILDCIQQKLKNKVQIKWPNDLYVNNKKIAGILIESVIMNNALKYVVVGIGLNVQQAKFSDNNPHATSLKLESGQNHERLELLNELIEYIQHYYQLLKNKQSDYIHQSYLKHLLNFNQTAYYKVDGRKIIGKIIGLDDHGRLELIINGQLRLFANKEIEFILP